MTTQHVENMGYIEFLRFENKAISFYIREGKSFFYCGADKVELGNELSVSKSDSASLLEDSIERIDISKEDFTEKGRITILVEKKKYYLVAFATDRFFGKKKKVFVLKAGNFEEE